MCINICVIKRCLVCLKSHWCSQELMARVHGKRKEEKKSDEYDEVYFNSIIFLNGLTHRYVQSNVKFDRLKSLFRSSLLVLLFFLVRMCVMLTLINIIGIDLLGGCLNLVKEDKKSSNPPQTLLNFLLL